VFPSRSAATAERPVRTKFWSTAEHPKQKRRGAEAQRSGITFHLLLSQPCPFLLDNAFI
jgi:hypothetical protein